MLKKLLLFSVMFLLLMSISVEPVEAGFFEDTWNWLMNLLGIGEEEAKALAKGMIGYNLDRILNEDGSTSITIYGGLRNVYEGGKWYRIEDAHSLMDTYNVGKIKIFYITDDSNYKIEKINELNYTFIDLEISVTDDKLLNKDIPIAVFKYNRTTENYEKKSDVKAKFTKLKSKNSVKLNDYKFGDRIKIGENSTFIFIGAVVDDVGDSEVRQGSPTLNYEHNAF